MQTVRSRVINWWWDAHLLGLDGSVTTFTSAIADIRGKLNLTYQITLDADHYISGMQLYNNGTTAETIFRTDTFKVARAGVGGTGVTMFEIATVNSISNQVALQRAALSDGLIIARMIFAHTITANEIAANTITAGEIHANTITANEIHANTITANEIAANTITANEIHAHTITANEIHANTITAGEIAAGTITANELHAGCINATTLITDNIIYRGHLIDGSAGVVDVTTPADKTFTLNAASTQVLVSKPFASTDGRLLIDAEFLYHLNVTTSARINTNFYLYVDGVQKRALTLYGTAEGSTSIWALNGIAHMSMLVTGLTAATHTVEIRLDIPNTGSSSLTLAIQNIMLRISETRR
jgi:hypothetical protein